MRAGDERAVVMEAEVASPFVVVESELAFQLPVVELDLPAQAGEASEPLPTFVLSEVGEPVVARPLLVLGPLDDQPLEARRLVVVADGMGGDDADEGEAAGDVLAGRRRAAGKVCHASAGSRSASARTDSGLRSGRATVRGRPLVPSRGGTAKVVSGP